MVLCTHKLTDYSLVMHRGWKTTKHTPPLYTQHRVGNAHGEKPQWSGRDVVCTPAPRCINTRHDGSIFLGQELSSAQQRSSVDLLLVSYANQTFPRSLKVERPKKFTFSFFATIARWLWHSDFCVSSSISQKCTFEMVPHWTLASMSVKVIWDKATTRLMHWPVGFVKLIHNYFIWCKVMDKL